MTRRLTGCILGALIALSLPGAGVGVVETTEGYRVILGNETPTFEALEEDPNLNGAPAPDEATLVDEADVEPWRGYERAWLANVTGSGSVLVMGERTGVVLEAEGTRGDGGTVMQEEGKGGEASEHDMEEPPREESDPDAGPAPGEGSGLMSAGREGNVEVGSGEGEGVELPGGSGGSWWLVGALFAVAGGLGVLEVLQRVRRGRAILVVPGLEGMREVVLVEATTGAGEDA